MTLDVASGNAHGPQVTDGHWRASDRRPKIEPAMRPPLVVVPDVDSEDPLQVLSAEDEGPVQALGPKRSHLSFAECVGVGGPDRG